MTWSLDDISWSRFTPAAIDAATVRLVKAAALVEANADDYVAYLLNVFHDDPAFQDAARQWGAEENQHGRALGRWAEMADPGFDFEDVLQCFRQLYRPDVAAAQSIRGSQAGELISRCVVECGTSSLYSALRDASAEPVLRQICHRIAGDEFRHYQLFRTHLQRYPRPPLWTRVRIAAGRVLETADDELASAWHAANVGDAPYNRRACARAYERHAVVHYRQGHVVRMVAMIAKAIELNPQARPTRWLQRFAWWLLQRRRVDPQVLQA